MRSDIFRLPTALFAAATIAAGGGGEAGSAEGGAAPGAAPAAAPAAAPDPATVGTISGTVNFAGTPPAMAAIDMSEEAACASAYSGSGPTSQEVVAANGKLANVFVYLKEGVSGAPAASGEVVLDQQNCRYTPHVLGVQVNQPVKIRNSDPVLHNINAAGTANRGFNISQPRQGIETTRQFNAPEVMVPVKCDVHGWMQAYIGVVSHPYFAVSGPGGNFTIANVPAGQYVAEAWHERYGTMTANVTVTAQGTAQVTFDYRADMAGADVPLGEPLVIRHDEHGLHAERGTLNAGAGR